MSFYISKVHATNENGEDQIIYYNGNHHWTSDPANRLIFDTAEEAATHLYDFGGEVTDVEPAPFGPFADITVPSGTAESTPVAEESVETSDVVEEEPMVTFDATPADDEVISFSSGSTSSGISFSSDSTTTSFGSDVTTLF